MSLITLASLVRCARYLPFSPESSQEQINPVNKAKEVYALGQLDPRYIGNNGIVGRITSPEEIEPLMQGGLILRSIGERYFLTRMGLLGGSPLDELERKLDDKAPDQISVFISYQWGQQDLARKIHKQFEDFKGRKFLVIRDENNLSNGVYLPGFMRIINHRNLDYIFVIVSDSYLKSKNCMYEVNQIVQRYKFTDSLLPLVITDDPNAKADIYSGIQKYLTYWQDKLAEAQRSNNLIDEEMFQNILKISRHSPIQYAQQSISRKPIFYKSNFSHFLT